LIQTIIGETKNQKGLSNFGYRGKVAN
jgi:hypothetical protein